MNFLAPRNRSTSLALLLLAAVAIVASCEKTPPPPTPPEPEPAPLAAVIPPPPAVDNVVLICIDTVGANIFDHAGVDDALARRLPAAQRYANAMSPAPWTIPSVASTLTGLYPLHHNAGRFAKPVANLEKDIPTALSDSAVTLAEMLDEQGFRTEAFAAHPWFRAGFGLEQGFDEIHPRNDRASIVSRFEDTLYLLTEGRPEPPPGAEANEPIRFFAYLHFMEAHDWHLEDEAGLKKRLSGVAPWQVQSLTGLASDAACADPASVRCAKNVVYNLAVQALRDSINAVFEALEFRGLAENTMVIVYSDHGEEFWQHEAQHEQRGDARSYYGFGHGHSMYEELLHVPLVAWHPQIEGAVHDDLVSLVDVVPTVMSWLGLGQPPHDIAGLPLPLPGRKTWLEDGPRTLYASGIAYGPETYAVREGHIKSIMQYPGDPYEFYDLNKDPDERQPLDDDRLVYHFDAVTGDYIETRGLAAGGAGGSEMDSATLEQLKSIGYLQGVDAEAGRQAQESDWQGEPTMNDSRDRENP